MELTKIFENILAQGIKEKPLKSTSVPQK